jgi:protein CsiD
MRGETSIERQGYAYDVSPLPGYHRLRKVTLADELVAAFLSAVSNVTARDVDYLPHTRFNLLEAFIHVLGGDVLREVSRLIVDREIAGCIVSTKDLRVSEVDLLKITIAMGLGVGRPDIDVLSGTIYGRLQVKGVGNKPELSNVYQPYSVFRLHTDGAASAADTTDWLVFAKTRENSASGGLTTILHLDDWDEFDAFRNHALGKKKFRISLPSSNDPRQKQWGNNVSALELDRCLFFEWNGYPCVRYADQFIHPRGIAEASFIRDLTRSLESSPGTHRLKLPVGSLIFLNNNYCLHGRTIFESYDDLDRELIRMRGELRSSEEIDEVVAEAARSLRA